MIHCATYYYAFHEDRVAIEFWFFHDKDCFVASGFPFCKDGVDFDEIPCYNDRRLVNLLFTGRM